MLPTERLYIIPASIPMLDALVDENWPELSALLGGVDFADHWYHFPEAYAWLRDFAKEHHVDMRWWSYVIVHREDIRVIGTCGFKGPPDLEGRVEIGYEIAESYWSKGYATEAAQALCQFAFAEPGVKAVTASTLAEENASTKLLRKLGFLFVRESMDIEDGRIWEWKLTP